MFVLSPGPKARYSLFVLKVPLNTNKPNLTSLFSIVIMIQMSCLQVSSHNAQRHTKNFRNSQVPFPRPEQQWQSFGG